MAGQRVSEINRALATEELGGGEIPLDAAALLKRNQELEAQLASKNDEAAQQAAALDTVQQQLASLRAQTRNQAVEYEALRNRLTEMTPLRYALFCSDPVWSRHCTQFTFFKSVASNDAFLEAINLKHDTEDAGICTRLRLYSGTTRATRLQAHIPDPGSRRLWQDSQDWAHPHCRGAGERTR